MRLDKYISNTTQYSRSQVKELIRKKRVCVNGSVVTVSDIKIDENEDCVQIDENVLSYTQYNYYILHKPQGYITATEDRGPTVMELLKDINIQNLFPVGRLDKDTEGLLLLTNDGDLAHKLLSPRWHVDKTYEVQCELPITQQMIECLENGVSIGDDKPTLPAKVTMMDSNRILLTIHEGRYHQVKRMLIAVGNSVTFLKRIAMGPLILEDSLLIGNYRELSEEEVQKLKMIGK